MYTLLALSSILVTTLSQSTTTQLTFTNCGKRCLDLVHEDDDCNTHAIQYLDQCFHSYGCVDDYANIKKMIDVCQEAAQTHTRVTSETTNSLEWPRRSGSTSSSTTSSSTTNSDTTSSSSSSTSGSSTSGTTTSSSSSNWTPNDNTFTVNSNQNSGARMSQLSWLLSAGLSSLAFYYF